MKTVILSIGVLAASVAFASAQANAPESGSIPVVQIPTATGSALTQVQADALLQMIFEYDWFFRPKNLAIIKLLVVAELRSFNAFLATNGATLEEAKANRHLARYSAGLERFDSCVSPTLDPKRPYLFRRSCSTAVDEMSAGLRNYLLDLGVAYPNAL